MSALTPFLLAGPDGKHIRGDHAVGQGRQILFITGFLSKRWGNKSKALAAWCQGKGWGFSCYDVRGFGDSEGQFTDYTLSDWIADARIAPGGAMVEGRERIVDARVDSALERIYRRLTYTGA